VIVDTSALLAILRDEPEAAACAAAIATASQCRFGDRFSYAWHAQIGQL
jgi:hypothetical protein